MSYFPSNAHPFAAAAPSSGWKHPDFCLEKRRQKKTASEPVLPFVESRFPPDEEKGRAFRSNNSRATSTTTLFSGEDPFSSKGHMLDDDRDFTDLSLADQASQGSTAVDSDLASIFFDELDLDVRLEAATPAPGPASVNWSKLLAEAVEFTRENIDLR